MAGLLVIAMLLIYTSNVKSIQTKRDFISLVSFYNDSKINSADIPVSLGKKIDQIDTIYGAIQSYKVVDCKILFLKKITIFTVKEYRQSEVIDVQISTFDGNVYQYSAIGK
ncbi:MAG: hypothetical protein JNM28_02925 [Armatimonadetes bacterium]|nr:hypothetical protein [Armatimonadota bacterium]